MGVVLHWFLPTNGDSRTDLSLGNAVGAALTQVTQRFKFLVAFRPGLQSPTLAAHMAATYQRISGGRLLLNVVTGGDDGEQRRFGDHLDKTARYARAGEFLDVVRQLWTGEVVNFSGEHFEIEGAQIIP